jgi:hypothetical protein
MKFNSKKVAFGRHETFALRYSWITKGFETLAKNPSIFTSEDATVVLGVGKNMVSAIRYWLLATRMVVVDSDHQLRPTALGKMVFGDGGYDPYLEDEGTIWLIHWLLSSNPQLATSWYWFFNRYHKQEFTSDECAAAIISFADQNIQTKFSKRTVEQDIKVMLRMYAKSKGTGRSTLEDALDSPLTLLNLVTRDTKAKNYRTVPQERNGLPLGIFGYAVLETMESIGVEQMPISDMMYIQGDVMSPGAVFRLTENALITKLESLVQLSPEYLDLRETAGIHQFYKLREITQMDLLEKHYADELDGRLAA